MKILVVSDTHRYQGNLYELFTQLDDIDYVIHCGDVEGCEDEIESVCDVPFVAVAGNNDFCSFLPRERVLEFMGHKIFVAHGHTYSVSSGLWRIIDEAKDRECDIALFGHTHIPTYSTDGSLQIMNPGSISLPRQASRRPSYGIIELKDDGRAVCSLYEM